jgi:Mg2+/Co2+ transporter CorB
VNLVQNLMVIAVLILISAFFSVSEISLAAARKIKLRQMAEEGDVPTACWPCRRSRACSLPWCRSA